MISLSWNSSITCTLGKFLAISKISLQHYYCNLSSRWLGRGGFPHFPMICSRSLIDQWNPLSSHCWVSLYFHSESEWFSGCSCFFSTKLAQVFATPLMERTIVLPFGLNTIVDCCDCTSTNCFKLVLNMFDLACNKSRELFKCLNTMLPKCSNIFRPCAFTNSDIMGWTDSKTWLCMLLSSEIFLENCFNVFVYYRQYVVNFVKFMFHCLAKFFGLFFWTKFFGCTVYMSSSVITGFICLVNFILENLKVCIGI